MLEPVDGAGGEVVIVGQRRDLEGDRAPGGIVLGEVHRRGHLGHEAVHEGEDDLVGRGPAGRHVRDDGELVAAGVHAGGGGGDVGVPVVVDFGGGVAGVTAPDEQLVVRVAVELEPELADGRGAARDVPGRDRAGHGVALGGDQEV